ncbi:LysR family transcriptional regulator [Paenibacillus elgii]|nr:LysR family transcriptional regulator [Paenibacillus elgii]MCM3268534.1 LysR family transcriptional regulator [Paenibacillus elgii]
MSFLDLRNLTYLLEVAKLQNFTKAAEALHMTQPTLSKLVRSMEEELGVTLFDRSGKQVKLTDAGSAAIQQIHHILQAVNDLYITLDDVSQLKTGTLTIGLPPVISSVFFPRVIAPFQKLYPRLQFEMVEEGAKNVEQRVLNGSIDLGVVISPDEEAGFGTMPFIRQQLALVLHRSHPLAQHPPVKLADLSREPFLMFAKGFGVRHHVLEACHQAGFHPLIAHESSQWDLLVEMVAAELGVALLPEAICSKVVNPDVRVLPMTNPAIPWNLVVIWNKERYVSYAMREFLRFVEQTSGPAGGEPVC